MTNTFNERAKLRLRLAAGLIGGEGRTLKLDRTNFYPEMLKVIESQTPAERERVKGLVDWLEDYEKEAKRQGLDTKPPKPVAKKRSR